MNEMITRIGERMITKMRIINAVVRDGQYQANMRKCPFYSEFVGMTQLLKAMDIDYDIEYDESVTYMIALVIMGKRFEVNNAE